MAAEMLALLEASSQSY